MHASMPIERLLTFLRCPKCESERLSVSGCDDCNFQFEYDGDTPVLMPDKTPMSYQSAYYSLQQVKEVLASAFVYPEKVGASNDVYHLEHGHDGVIKALKPNSVILEVGCGGGQMREYARALGHDYIGSDVSKIRVVEELQKYGGPDIICDAHALPIKSNKIDLIYSAAVTEHLACPQKAVQEFFRVLRPGGFYLGNCSFLEPWHDESFFHITPNGAAALLLQSGFEPQRIWPSKGYSGYDALFAMDNSAMSAISFMGPALRFMSHTFLSAKRRMKRSSGYSDQDHLQALAITAGAVDWVAKKPA